MRPLDRFGLPTDAVLRWTLRSGRPPPRRDLQAALARSTTTITLGVVAYFLRSITCFPRLTWSAQGYHPPALLPAGGTLRRTGRCARRRTALARTVGRQPVAAGAPRGDDAAHRERRGAVDMRSPLPRCCRSSSSSVMFVSNDFAVVSRRHRVHHWWRSAYIERPTTRWLVALGVALGVGLLTKGTFLAFVPGDRRRIALAVAWRRRVGTMRALGQTALCVAIAATVGSYKFVENYRRLGRPIVHNLDIPSDGEALSEGNDHRMAVVHRLEHSEARGESARAPAYAPLGTADALRVDVVRVLHEIRTSV